MTTQNERCARNGDVVVIEEELDVQALGDSETGSLSVVTLLLRAVRAEEDDRLALVSKGNTVDHGPGVTETARGELDTRSKAKLRVAWELGVGISVREQVLKVQVTVKGREQVLGGDTVTSLVKEGVVDFVAGGAGQEGQEDGDLRDSVKGTTLNRRKA